MAGARTAQPDQGGGRRPQPYHPQPDPGSVETGLQAPARSRHRKNPPTRPGNPQRLGRHRRLRRQPRPAADEQRGPCASPSLPDASASEPGPKRAAPLTPPLSVSSKHAVDAEAIPGRTSQIPSLEHAAAFPTSPFLPPPKKSGEVNGYGSTWVTDLAERRNALAAAMSRVSLR